MKHTKKLHHEFPFLASCEAEILEINPEKGLMLSQTIGYAEQGGQVGDTGILNHKGQTYNFIDTQNVGGRPIFLPDFPVVNVDQKVYHKLREDIGLENFKAGDTIKIEINRQRRFDITRAHSAIHLVLMGVESVRPGYYNNIKGCSIRELAARLDFSGEKFTEDEMKAISDYTNNLVARNLEMEVTQHEKEEDAWFWRLENYKIACGGSHLHRTGQIDFLSLKKKNIGKNLTRISTNLLPASIPPNLFT